MSGQPVVASAQVADFALVIGAGFGAVATLLFIGAGFDKNKSAELSAGMSRVAGVAAYLGAVFVLMGTIAAVTKLTGALAIVAFVSLGSALITTAFIMLASRFVGLLGFRARRKQNRVNKSPNVDEDKEPGADGAKAKEGVAKDEQEAPVEPHEDGAVDGEIAQALAERREE